MITIKISENFFNERKYIFEYLFDDLYKSDFLITKSDEKGDSVNSCIIVLDNGKKIYIEDHFFYKFTDDKQSVVGKINGDYIHYKNIPKRVQFGENEFVMTEENIPIIYGENEVISTSDKIISKIDIISSLFFLLSRWEEIAITKRDKHNRFPEIKSLLFRNNLLNRPVANEYIEMLWNMIIKLDPDIKHGRNERSFSISLSHDIDEFRKYKDFFQISKKLFANLFIRFSVKDFFSDIIEVINVKVLKNQMDPYNTCKSLMNLSEELNTKSTFFLKTGGNSKFDRNRYSVDEEKDVINIMKEVLDRGHEIALHYSYLSLLDERGGEQKKISYVKNEKYKLEKIINSFTSSIDFENLSDLTRFKADSERIHFLRFNVESSFNKLEEIGITKDHSMGFSTENGFRAGICYEYPIWNFETRKQFEKLKEYPLIVMDTILIESRNLSKEEQKQEIKHYHDIVKKYNGNFTFLIHNSTDKSFYNLVYDVLKVKDRRKNRR